MADSSALDSCEQHVEGAEDNPENCTFDSVDVEVGENGVRTLKAETAGDNDAGKDGGAPEADLNPRVVSFPAADDVAGAVALDAPPSTLTSSDSDKVGVGLGALSLGDCGESREFKGASIYPEVGKSNLTPSNFQASFTLQPRRAASPDIATYLTPITHLSQLDLQSHWGEGRSNSDVVRYHSPLSATRPRMRANQTLASQQRPVAVVPVVSAADPAVASKALNLSSSVKELNPQQQQPQPVTPAPIGCAVAASASEEDPYEARIESANRRQNGIYNWQSTKSTIKERLEAMLHSDLLADVFFVVGRGTTQQKVPAHKFVLSIGLCMTTYSILEEKKLFLHFSPRLGRV